jgi:hypothetical protein
MKKLTLVSASLLTILFSSAESMAKIPHATIDPQSLAALKPYMHNMEMQYVNLQILTSSSTPNWDAIKQSLDGMKKLSAKIRKLNPEPKMNEPLSQLANKIASLKQQAKEKKIQELSESLDALDKTCFKCHAIHTPKVSHR